MGRTPKKVDPKIINHSKSSKFLAEKKVSKNLRSGILGGFFRKTPETSENAIDYPAFIKKMQSLLSGSRKNHALAEHLLSLISNTLENISVLEQAVIAIFPTLSSMAFKSYRVKLACFFVINYSCFFTEWNESSELKNLRKNLELILPAFFKENVNYAPFRLAMYEYSRRFFKQQKNILSEGIPETIWTRFMIRPTIAASCGTHLALDSTPLSAMDEYQFSPQDESERKGIVQFLKDTAESKPSLSP